jgi:O-antigen/teichoic acid export membrane protein
MIGREARTSPESSDSQSAFRRLTGHFGALLAGAGATRAVSLVSQIAIARILGPSALGAVAVALAVLNIANVLTDGGLTTLTLRRIVREPERRSGLVSATLILQTLFSFVCVGVLAMVAWLVPWHGDIATLLVVFSPTLVFAALNMGYVLQAVELMGTLALARVAAAVIPAVLSVALVALTHRAAWIAVANCVGYSIAALLVYLKLKTAAGLRLVRPPASDVRSLSRQSRPFLATSLLLLVPAVSPTISVGLVRDAHSVGLFNAVWQLSFAVTTIAALLVDALYPEMIRRWDDGRLSAFLNVIVGLTLRVTLPAAAVVSFAAGSIIHLFYGPAFSGSTNVLRAIIWMVPLGFVWSLLGQGLSAADAQRRLVVPNLALALLAIVAGPFAASRVGIVGVAGVVVGGYAVQVLWYIGLSIRRHTLDSAWRLGAELPYALFPAGLCFTAQHFHQGGIGAMLAAGLAGMLAAELIRGLPTLRLLRRSAAQTQAVATSATSSGTATTRSGTTGQHGRHRHLAAGSQDLKPIFFFEFLTEPLAVDQSSSDVRLRRNLSP